MTAETFTLVDGDHASAVPPSVIEALVAAGDRPLAVDRDEGVAYLGETALVRATRLASLDAPDFSLPDLEGRVHSLSQFRGTKVLLVAYASW